MLQGRAVDIEQKEKLAIQFLAKEFFKKKDVTREEIVEAIDAEGIKVPLGIRLVELGYLKKSKKGSMHEEKRPFTIHSSVVDAARELNQPVDQVNKITDFFRTRQTTAWVLSSAVR